MKEKSEQGEQVHVVIEVLFTMTNVMV